MSLLMFVDIPVGRSDIEPQTDVMHDDLKTCLTSHVYLQQHRRATPGDRSVWVHCLAADVASQPEKQKLKGIHRKH